MLARLSTVNERGSSSHVSTLRYAFGCQCIIHLWGGSSCRVACLVLKWICLMSKFCTFRYVWTADRVSFWIKLDSIESLGSFIFPVSFHSSSSRAKTARKETRPVSRLPQDDPKIRSKRLCEILKTKICFTCGQEQNWPPEMSLVQGC